MDLSILDEMIEYIENNLKGTIKLESLSKIVGLPPYILERVFSFITNMTIKEYIKKRRLSKAYIELHSGKMNVTTAAFTFGYSSNSSFSRAFKKYFDILPKNIKKNQVLLSFPKISFNKNIVEQNLFNYKIKNINQLTLYGKKCLIDDDNYISQIYKLYSTLENKGILSKFKESTWYGITIIEDAKEYYFVGNEEYNKELEKFTLPNLKYLIIEIENINQKEIVNTEINCHYSYLPSTNYISYDKTNIYELEIYDHNKTCSIALPIK